MDRDFSSHNISAELNRKCRIVYDEFVREAGVPSWGLTILGQQVPEVMVSATDPDGRMLRESVMLTVDAQEDIHDLLLRSYEVWRASNKR